MKRYLLLLITILSFSVAFAQPRVNSTKTPPSGSTAGNTWDQWYSLGVPSNGYMFFPYGTNLTPNRAGGWLPGMGGVQWSDTTFQVVDPNGHLVAVGKGGNSNLYLNPAYFNGDGTTPGTALSVKNSDAWGTYAVPSVTGNTGKVLSYNGTNFSWIAPGGGGTVTNVSGVNGNGITWTITNPTTTPSLQFALDSNKYSYAPDLILTGMVTSMTTSTNAQTTAGTARIGQTVYTFSLTNTTVPAQDATLRRYSIISATTSSTLVLTNGTLATDPTIPSVPSGNLLVATIYIPSVADGASTTSTGGNGKGIQTLALNVPNALFVNPPTGSPANKANSVISVALANQATHTIFGNNTGGSTAPLFFTPGTLTLGYGVTGTSFNLFGNTTATADTTSSTGLVSKPRLATNLGGYVPKTTTVAGFALSSNVTLANHIAGYGLSGSNYAGSSSQTWTADTTSSGGLVSKPRLATNLGGYQKTITLTTTGSSGAATLIGQTLNIPNYSAGGGGLTAANNGLSVSTTTVQKGGSLIQNTNTTNGGFYERQDSTIFGTRTTYTARSGNLYVFGSSIAAGSVPTGVTPWPSLVATQLGLTLHNFATSGYGVQNRGSALAGSYLSQTGSIPTYSGLTGNFNYLVVETGPNDYRYGNGCTNYNTTNYTTDLTSFISACTTAGWPSSHIIILNNSYVMATVVGQAVGCSGTFSLATYATYQTATQSVCTSTGAQFFDVYTFLSTRGASDEMYDFYHPNQDGQTKEATYIANLLVGAVEYAVAPGTGISTQPLTVNGGQAGFSNINMANFGVLPEYGNGILGMNSTGGNLGFLNSLPDNTRTGPRFWINGRMINYGTDTTNMSLSRYDWAGTGLKIKSVYGGNNTYIGTLQLFDASGALHYTTSSAYNSPTANIFALTSASGTSFQVQQNGTTTISGPINANSLSSNNSGNINVFTLWNGLGTTYQNGYNSDNAFIAFQMSPVSINTYSDVARWFRNGHAGYGGLGQYNGGTVIVDNGFSGDFAGSVRSENALSVGIVGQTTGVIGTPSTSGGTIPAGTLDYIVIAVDAFGNQSTRSAEIGVTTTGSTSSVSVAFTPVSGAVSYQLWIGSGVGAENKYVTGTTTPIVYTGSGTTSGTLPAANVNKTAMAQISGAGVVFPAAYTVSTLPAASSNKNGIAVVTDANSPTWGSTVSGGGSTTVSVISNGTNWLVN